MQYFSHWDFYKAISISFIPETETSDSLMDFLSDIKVKGIFSDRNGFPDGNEDTGSNADLFKMLSSLLLYCFSYCTF